MDQNGSVEATPTNSTVCNVVDVVPPGKEAHWNNGRGLNKRYVILPDLQNKNDTVGRWRPDVRHMVSLRVWHLLRLSPSWPEGVEDIQIITEFLDT